MASMPTVLASGLSFFSFQPLSTFLLSTLFFSSFTTHLPYIHASSLTLTPLSFLLLLHPLPPLHAYTSFLPSHLPEVMIRNTSFFGFLFMAMVYGNIQHNRTEIVWTIISTFFYTSRCIEGDCALFNNKGWMISYIIDNRCFVREDSRLVVER